MARTKRNSSTNRTTNLSKQEIYSPAPNGKHILINEGEDILVKCEEDDIVPGKTYYMINVMRPNVFYAQEFDPIVEWETIQMLIKYNRIWQLKEEVHV